MPKLSTYREKPPRMNPDIGIVGEPRENGLCFVRISIPNEPATNSQRSQLVGIIKLDGASARGNA